MKVKVLSRNPDEYLRETKKDIHKVPRNYDPTLHPFEAPREYTRALNAVKLERVFAKPFIGALSGHSDGVHCMCKHPKALSHLLSGSYDGEIKLWDLPRRQCLKTVTAHDGFVRGLCFNPNGQHFYSDNVFCFIHPGCGVVDQNLRIPISGIIEFNRIHGKIHPKSSCVERNIFCLDLRDRWNRESDQCGEDKTVKQWSMEEGKEGFMDEPINTILTKRVFQDIDHHWQDAMFATCGQQLDIWDEERTEPTRTFTWGLDSIHAVKFNPIEHHILGGCASDRSVLLYDMRGATPLRKVVLKMKSNQMAWNPLEAFVFTVANEDYNLYTFDMRKLDMPLNVHMDHVSAVLDVDYAPTGKDFVSGSYDRTVRIFQADKGRSREVYHTKRMQRVQCVVWSLDNKYILSGSDEMNIRLWKANAAEKLGVLKPREKEAFRYNDKLKEKFQHHPQVKRIARHRHVPKSIYHAKKEIDTIRFSKKRKEANVRAHSKPGTVPFVPERKKAIVGQLK